MVSKRSSCPPPVGPSTPSGEIERDDRRLVPQTRLGRHALGAALALVGTAGQMALRAASEAVNTAGDPSPFTSYQAFLGAVALSALWCGRGVGFTCLAACTVSDLFFFIPPIFSLRIDNPAVALQVVLFLAVGGMICVMGGALQRSAEEFSATLTSIGDGVIATSCDGTVKLMNPVAEALTGWRRGEARGQPAEVVAVFLEEASCEPIDNPARQAIRDHLTATRSHILLSNRAGPHIPVEANAAAIRDRNGTVIGAVLVVRDVSELRRTERALQELTKELKRSNTELEQFAYVASHDLQEPLRTISGCVQLLRQRYAGKLDDRADEFIGHTVEGAERMQTLINDLLTFSRVATRGKDLQPTDCARVLDDVVRNLAAAVREHGAEITSNPLPSVRADPSQLAQLLQNLIANAIKFRTSEPPRIHVSATQEESDWRFSVQDNGIGIEPQYFERIFEVFKRLHTRKEYPGNGIGLALSKKIVERHGGRIWLESMPGRGTTFYFTIPTPR